jgi:CRISPR-associated protein Cmr5
MKWEKLMSATVPTTRQQAYAQRAYECISQRKLAQDGYDDYARFAKSFPALIQSSGLCQAVAFAEAKKHIQYLQDVVQILQDSNLSTKEQLLKTVRTAPVTQYLFWSRNVSIASMWLKRYVEALAEQD